MAERIAGISRDYDGYGLKVVTYENESYNDEGEVVTYDTRYENHEFGTAEELESYADEHDLLNEEYDYEIRELRDGTWLIVTAYPASEFES